MVDDVDQGSCGVDLNGAGSAQEWLDFGQVAEDPLPLLGWLAIAVRRASVDASEEYLSWSAQQDDLIKTPIEPALIRHCPGHVERRAALAGQEVGDSVLAPDEAVLAVRPLSPPWLIGIDDLETELAQLDQRARLAGSRHAGDKNSPHVRSVTSARPDDGYWAAAPLLVSHESPGVSCGPCNSAPSDALGSANG